MLPEKNIPKRVTAVIEEDQSTAVLSHPQEKEEFITLPRSSFSVNSCAHCPLLFMMLGSIDDVEQEAESVQLLFGRLYCRQRLKR
jgi:hypothetical protein